MDRCVARELDKRFATLEERSKQKNIIDLALNTYLKENPPAKTQSVNRTMDSRFKQAAIDNIKVFIFAGHDTSSSAICYAFYHLSRNPETLAAVRKEHDAVFGTDVSKVGEIIEQEPHLINKLDWTMAVIREVLRLHPPASTIRIGNKEYDKPLSASYNINRVGKRFDLGQSS